MCQFCHSRSVIFVMWYNPKRFGTLLAISLTKADDRIVAAEINNKIKT